MAKKLLATVLLSLSLVLLSAVPAFASTNLISNASVHVSSGYGVAGGSTWLLTNGDLATGDFYQDPIDFWYKFSAPVSVTGYEFYGSGSVSLDLYNSSGAVIWSGLVSAYGSVVSLTLSQDVAGFDLSNGSGGATYAEFELFGPSLPSVPSGLAVSGSGSSGVLSWNASPTSDSVTSYNVYQDGVKVGSASGTSYSLSGLGIGTYSLAVSAVNSVGESALSPAVSYVVQGVPGIVTGLSASGGGASSGVLSWTASPASDSVTNYNIYDNSALIAQSTTNSYSFSGLTEGLNSFQVSAVNSTGEGPLSSVVNYTVFPASPTGLSSGSITNTSFTAYWLKQSDADSYNVYLDGILLGNVMQPLVSNPAYSVTSLQPGSTHSLTVTAVNQWGESAPSQPLSVTTTVPSPTLKATLDSHNINLTWTGLGSDFDILINSKQVAQATASPYVLTEQPGTYQIQVVQNYNGQQYPSNMVSVTVSAMATVSSSTMAGDLFGNVGTVMLPMGGLLALALAIKGSPFLIATVKASMLGKWFK